MGSGFVGARRILCEGDDIVGALNDVFDKQPGDPKYDEAMKAIDAFMLPINTGNPKHLLGAYMAAGVQVTSWPHWEDYLVSLAAGDADNIKKIARARREGLAASKKMKTKRHPPGGDHTVHKTNKPDGSIEIDSPFTPDSLCP